MAQARGFAYVGILALVALACQGQNRQPATIVFVCEHGSAKSVIATAHFNRLAEAKGLPYRAVSRGTHPDTEIPALIRTGLLADGLDVSRWKPKLISDDDMRQAARVITLACELPKTKSLSPNKRIDWENLPAVSDGYAEARAAIVARIDELLNSLSNSLPK